MTMKKLIAAILATTLMAVGAFAAKQSCGNGAQEGWMSMQALMQTTKGQGYDARKLKIEQGC